MSSENHKTSIKDNGLFRFAIYFLATTVAVLSSFGSASLGFFFARQAGLDMAMSFLSIYVASAIIGAIIFATYVSIFVIGFWDKATYFLNPEDNQEDNAENVPEDTEELSVVKKLLLVTAVILGFIGILSLAGGAYLGVMTIGQSLNALNIFFPWAIITATGMFLSMSGLFIPILITNTKAMLSSTQSNRDNDAEQIRKNAQKSTQQKEAEQSRSLWAKLIKWSHLVMAIGATVGFAAFKVYSTVHLVQLLGVTSQIGIIASAAVSFATILFMTGITSGVIIWDEGKKLSKEYQEHGYLEKAKTPAWLYYLGWTLTGLSAILNGAASYMGIATISGFACGLFPAAAFIIAPAFTITGIAVAICRAVEYWRVYGNVIENNYRVKTTIIDTKAPSNIKPFDWAKPEPKPARDNLFTGSYSKPFSNHWGRTKRAGYVKLAALSAKKMGQKASREVFGFK